MKWAYGVTTVASRRDNLLPRTLSSLKAAGFDTPRLFVDGCSSSESWGDEFNLPISGRDTNMRTYGNWFLALMELYLREPRAERYALFQDDFIASKNLKQYLEVSKLVSLKESDDSGLTRKELILKQRRQSIATNSQKWYQNLYTFPSNQILAGKHIGWFPSNQRGKGAVALVFPNDAVTILLRSEYMIARPLDMHRGHKSIDGGICMAMRHAGYSEYCHSPSLVQHIGTTSSMGNDPQPEAQSFRGENFDCMSILTGVN